MLGYISRRLGTLVVILLGSSFILFNLAAISTDPIGELRFSQDPKAKQLMMVITRELNLDVPPPLRYFLWLKGILGALIGHGDFGVTRTHEPVSSALATAIPTTLRLVTSATLIAIILGIAIGIVTALRQYSQFDYVMTFIAFLLFSLPIFWVAVLLKQFLAIQFNDFLADPKIATTWLVWLSLFSGFLWASIIGGERKKYWSVFSGVTLTSGVIITLVVRSGWLKNPGLGPIGILIIGIGVAFGITHLSVGLSDKKALKSSLVMVLLALIAYYPSQIAFNSSNKVILFPLMVILTIALAIVVTFIFTKIDRGPILRTTIITAVIMSLFVILDKLMHTWKEYFENDAINGRPVPTIGQANVLLEPGNYWLTTLDLLMHLVLPTMALTAISFAGYIRYSRGTLLEVLNQDYIRTARSKGLTERTVIMRHAFRNTLIPLTTIIVVDIASIVGGAIITERVFGWQGMGTLFNNALSNFDLNLLMGVFLVTGSLAVLANLVADLLYSALDPRIRVGSN
jgi:peptide/nickel transport system permease protein